jgi:protein-tyrosine phosphatase
MAEWNAEGKGRRVIDLHGHQLPGVDDGAVDLAATRQAIDRMLAQGVEGFVVTPHVRATRLLADGGPERVAMVLDTAWSTMTEMCATEYPDLVVRRGAEVMLDHPLPDLSPDWVRLGGTRFALVEFPSMMIPPRAVDALVPLVRAGITPVVAHPERYRNANLSGAEAISWKRAGALLQVNSGSLLGNYGTEATQRARKLLALGAVDYLAGDYHCRGPYPIDECRRILQESGGADQADELLSVNPARLLEGLDPVEVRPLEVGETRWRVLAGMRKWLG